MSRFFTIDFAIVAAYLLITLVVGIVYGRGITTMRQYVIGGYRRYGNFILVASLFATAIGGGTLGDVERVFNIGIIWLFAISGIAVKWFLVARYVAPHVGRFRKKLSMGEMLGDFYGKPGQISTGIAGFFLSLGFVAVQISAIGYMFSYFIGLANIFGVLIACFIVVLYSSFGGIRSVTATDIIQFCVLFIVLPVIALQAAEHAGWYGSILKAIPAGHLDLVSHKDFWKYLFIFFLMAVPSLTPADMQRLLMAGDAEQAYDTLRISAALELVLIFITGLIGFSAIAINSEVQGETALLYVIDNVLSDGFRGAGIASLFALIMSTADSYLHVASVSFVHDVVKPIRKQSLPDEEELKLTRVIAVLAGIIAIVAALSFKSIVDLMLAFANFWAPIVPVPWFIGVIGYRSSVRSFCIAAIVGGATALSWKLGIENYVSFDGTVPGMLANLLAFVIARRFDKPEDLHFGEEELKDPRWRKYVELYRQKREKEGRGALNPVALISDCGRALRVWLGDLLEEWLPTPHKVRHFCRWLGLHRQIPYDRIAGLTLALPVVYLWQGFGGRLGNVMLGCSAAGALGGILVMLRQQLKWRWLHADLDVLLWGSYLLALPFAHAMGVVGAQRPVGWMILLVGGLMIPLQTMDARSALRLWVSGVVLGGITALAAANWTLSPELAALLHGVPANGELPEALAQACTGLGLQVLGGVVVSAIAVALLAGCREELAETRVQELLLERAKVGHDINNHLVIVRDTGRKTIKILNDLLKLTPELSQPLRWRIRLKIKRLRLEVKGTVDRAKEGLVFCNALMTEAKDPLNYVPKMGSVHLGICIRKATSMACKNREELSRFHRNAEELDCCVWGNQTRLIHALANLGRNAVNHTRPGDTIEWKTEKDGQVRRFWLQDTGPGIAYRDLPLLLKPGFSRRKGGHGFGLSNTKEGVKPGYVHVSSLRSCGATFTVEMYEPTEEQLAAEKAEQEHKTRHDETTNRDIVQGLQYHLQEIRLEAKETFEHMKNLDLDADSGHLNEQMKQLREEERKLCVYVRQFGGDPQAEPEDVDDDGIENEEENHGGSPRG